MPTIPDSEKHPMIDNQEILVAVIPTIGGCMLFFAIIGIVVFIYMARKKRSLHGTYSPQNEEFKSPIIEMKDLKFEIPDERYMERLI